MIQPFFKGISLTSLLLIFSACSSDELPKDSNKDPEKPILEVLTYQVVTLTSDLATTSSTRYDWKLLDAPTKAHIALTGTDTATPRFITDQAGTYKLKLTLNQNGVEQQKDYTLQVSASSQQVSRYLSRVYEFNPSVGQFVNIYPPYESGDTSESMRLKAEQCLAHKKNGDIVSLGGFGGNIIIGFDHTIINVEGEKDFRILGNAFTSNVTSETGESKKGGSSEPGIIRVAYDANKNGKPDADEWYEIAGSEYENPETIHQYRMTYTRPQTEDLFPVTDGYITNPQYLFWEDNQGNSGYKIKNSFHAQSYYPLWIQADQLTFEGTLLPANAYDTSGNGSYWVLYAYAYGYADNVQNSDEDSSIDIGWAVDAHGNPANLPGIDFIQVYTGINQECGWIGETSTEISGAEDLHIAE